MNDLIKELKLRRSQHIKLLSDFDKIKPSFVIINEQTGWSMGADYGPPDPPPSMESYTDLKLTGLLTEEEVIEWIKNNETKSYGKIEKYKIFKIDPVNIKTEVKISLEK